jgi:hypothetical protein
MGADAGRTNAGGDPREHNATCPTAETDLHSIPGTVYWSTVLCGLAASLVIIAVTFPLLDRITGPEVARNG